MPRRSARLIYAYWDDRDESLGEESRRRSRRSEHMRDLPELWCDAITWERRTIYPDAGNPRVTSRAGPPDDAWARDAAAGAEDQEPPWFLR